MPPCRLPGSLPGKRLFFERREKKGAEKLAEGSPRLYFYFSAR
jgi:hypothetical protein